MRWALALAAALFAAAAFAGGDQQIRLSPEAPRQTVPLPPASAGDEAVLRVRISAIDNPAMVPFGVVVRTADGTEIGRFAVFPADQTGDYHLSLRPAERAALAQPDAAVSLALDLQGKTAERLTVTIESVQIR